jgi:hypothetical protein
LEESLFSAWLNNGDSSSVQIVWDNKDILRQACDLFNGCKYHAGCAGPPIFVPFAWRRNLYHGHRLW